MLWPLLCLLPLVGGSRLVAQEVSQKARHVREEAVAVTTRPHIYYCRSPNMEDFTCWWHPLDNLTEDEVTYVLTYSKDKGPKHECPDYVTGGPNSCHFDRSHTSIWKMYCVTVTAITAFRNYSSPKHCLDVAEIVETEAPVNLTFHLADAGGDEMGHSALLSWEYPRPEDLQYGWITLEYELQYRRVAEPDNWKVKHPLREAHVELLGLRVGDYVVRVRCRSHNSRLWSKWSSKLLMNIPSKPPTGKVLVLILVAGVGVVALLVVMFGIIPHSKRIKDYFLPPIPKPRILGIDPLLLKKGNLEEINRHFSSFHSYEPPRYSEEVWDPVSSDGIYLTTPKFYNFPSDLTDRVRGALKVPGDPKPVAAQHPFPAITLAPYAQSVPPYCSSPPGVLAPLLEAPPPRLEAPPPRLRPEMVTLPGTDYSMMEHPGHALPPPDSAPFPASHAPQDFYTCVHLMNESGEVHLVPCLPSAYCQEFPPFLAAAAEEEKKKKLAEYQAWKSMLKDAGESERSEAAVPLLPVSVDNTG